MTDHGKESILEPSAGPAFSDCVADFDIPEWADGMEFWRFEMILALSDPYRFADILRKVEDHAIAFTHTRMELVLAFALKGHQFVEPGMHQDFIECVANLCDQLEAEAQRRGFDLRPASGLKH